MISRVTWVPSAPAQPMLMMSFPKLQTQGRCCLGFPPSVPVTTLWQNRTPTQEDQSQAPHTSSKVWAKAVPVGEAGVPSCAL